MKEHSSSLNKNLDFDMIAP